MSPTKIIRVHASASRYRADSTIVYRRPENFTLDTSLHQETGKSIEGGLGLVFAPASVDASFTRFDNRGTTPFKIDRFRGRAMFKVIGQTGAVVEWDHDRYNEPTPSYGDFTANRYGIYLHWTQ